MKYFPDIFTYMTIFVIVILFIISVFLQLLLYKKLLVTYNTFSRFIDNEYHTINFREILQRQILERILERKIFEDRLNVLHTRDAIGLYEKPLLLNKVLRDICDICGSRHIIIPEIFNFLLRFSQNKYLPSNTIINSYSKNIEEIEKEYNNQKIWILTYKNIDFFCSFIPNLILISVIILFFASIINNFITIEDANKVGISKFGYLVLQMKSQTEGIAINYSVTLFGLILSFILKIGNSKFNTKSLKKEIINYLEYFLIDINCMIIKEVYNNNSGSFYIERTENLIQKLSEQQGKFFQHILSQLSKQQEKFFQDILGQLSISIDKGYEDLKRYNSNVASFYYESANHVSNNISILDQALLSINELYKKIQERDTENSIYLQNIIDSLSSTAMSLEKSDTNTSIVNQPKNTNNSPNEDKEENPNFHHHYYTDISCPRRIWVETPRISVVVRLRIKPPKYSDAPVQQLSVNTELPVSVRIDAPAFNILSDAEQEITVQPNIDSIPLVFDLQPRPENIGHTHINFDFFQAGNPIGNTASISVEITAYETNSQAELIQGIIRTSSNKVPPPDLKLYIKYEYFHNQPALYFTLFQGDSIGRELPPIKISGDPKTYITSLYEQLNNSREVNERITKPQNNEIKTPTLEELENRQRIIKEVGFKLWKDLIPNELKNIYLKNRENWREQKLLLVSDEPYIPWELVWPYDKTNRWEDEFPWCISLQMTRWLRRDAEGNGHEVAPTELSLQKLACIAPQDTTLPYALQEKKFINELITQYKIDDVSPNCSSLSAIRKLLEETPYSWFHIATHGLYNDHIPDDASAINLENGEMLTLGHILGPKIEGHINSQRPGFVFNACHSARQAWALTGLGGWPNSLISAGAGLFVAPLWQVSDDLAFKFAQTFYQELFKGKTVAEAIYASRLAVKKEGNFTWLAYTVYAHPNAKITHNKSEDFN